MRPASSIDWLARQPRFGGSLRGLEAQLSRTEALLACARKRVARFVAKIEASDVPLPAEFRQKWLMTHDQLEQRLETVHALGRA